MMPAITCEVHHVVDADTLDCGRHRIRLAGISARERDGSCNSAPACATMPYQRARAIVTRLALGRSYRFTLYGTSGKRSVGDAPALRCAILASAAAVAWPRYIERYRLGRCG